MPQENENANITLMVILIIKVSAMVVKILHCIVACLTKYKLLVD
jgi:hypothetical protein